MDRNLLESYAAAVRLRPLFKLLPADLQSHCLMFEQMDLADIREQSNNPELSEAEALGAANVTINKVIQVIYPLLSQLGLLILKRYWPAAATAILTYFAATK